MRFMECFDLSSFDVRGSFESLVAFFSVFINVVSAAEIGFYSLTTLAFSALTYSIKPRPS